MPRIRSIKPEFFRSKILAGCSPRARLTYIGLWTLADDEGRYEYEPELLKADLWPWEHDVTPKDADVAVQELEGPRPGMSVPARRQDVPPRRELA